MSNPLPFLSMLLQLPLQASAGRAAGASPLAGAPLSAKKPTWSQQEGIGGKTKHNITKISPVRHLLRVCQCLAVLLCMGSAFNARAAFTCTAYPPFLDMFSGAFGSFFAFPDDAAALPIGARVGGLREVNLRFICTGMGVSEKFGTGMQAVSGLTWHAATQTWTSPQLEALGLGFRMWWHEPITNINHNPDAHPNNNPTIDYAPVNWYNRPSATADLKISTRVIFFKINDNFQNTDGTLTFVTVTQDLFKFYIAEQSQPTTPRGQVLTYTLNLSTFSSKQRVCTPLANKTINFASISADEMPTQGVVASRTEEFSLHFNCPYMAYYMVGFKLDGLDGVLDADNGVYGIKQGPGYASGVGVQFSGKGVATSWRDNQNYQPNVWRVLKPDQNYSIPYFEYTTKDVSLVNPAIATRQKTVDFKVSYYRMPGTALQGGKVESRVVVRLVYQ